jgi:hypothetical protein
VHQEATDLHLADGIESHEADEGIGEGLGAAADLLEDLLTILAAEHGELPHGPVAVVFVARGDGAEADRGVLVHIGVLGVGELQARGEAVADDVVNLRKDRWGLQGEYGDWKGNAWLVEQEGLCIGADGRLAAAIIRTCLVMSLSERGGRKEKVSKNCK